MPATWNWLSTTAGVTWNSVGNGIAVAEFSIGAGLSVQRIITFGGFTWTKILTGSSGGRQQHALPISGNFRVQVDNGSGVVDTLTLQQFTFERSGTWSAGATSLQAAAAGLVWATPPRIFDSDIESRWRSLGGGLVRASMFYVGSGMGTDGLVSPEGQAFGALHLRVLTSSSS